MRVHSYDGHWPDGKCVHCGRTNGLDEEQTKEIHKSMCKCEKGRKVTFGERFKAVFTERYDCSIIEGDTGDKQKS